MISKITLKVLTPIHIGSGMNYNNLEYFINGNKLSRVDVYRVYADPGFRQYRDVIINAALNAKGNSMKGIYEIAPRLAEQNILYELKTRGGVTGRSEIREHIKTNLMPYIPASSLKGSVLTALAYSYYRSNPDALDSVLQMAKGSNYDKKKASENVLSETIKSVAGSIQKNPRFANWLRISDPEPAQLDKLFVGSISTYPSGPPVFAEMIAPGTAFDFEFEVSPDQERRGVGLDEILKRANAFYSEVLLQENAWRKNHSLSPLDFSGEGTLVRIGTGSSKIATSLALLTGSRQPKTRKLVDPDRQSMGWASLCRRA